MARTGITQKEVFAVIEEMCAVREKVTTLNIHARLGRGSVNTIHKHLLVWKHNRLWNLKQSNSDVNRYDPELEEHLAKQQELNQELSRELLIKLSHAEQAIQPYQQQLRDFERLANKLGLWDQFIKREREIG